MIETDLEKIQQPGVRFEGKALVKSVQERTTADGHPYFNITLVKKEKTISCKLWENHFGGQTVLQLKEETFRQGNVVFVTGNVSHFNNELQLTIDSFHILSSDEFDLQEFLACAPEPLEQLQKEYESYIEEIESPILKEITKSLYEEHKEKFVKFPAGKTLHHAVVGGLLWHVVSMLRLAKHIVQLYPEVRKDLLYAGICLHDLGKVIELSDFIAPEYTKVGNFLGHITIVNMLIDRKAQKLKEEPQYVKEFQKVYELMHIISAHHGKLEWGSPVLPQLLEAEVLHQIDMLDSRVNMIVSNLAKNPHKDFERPVKVHPLGNFYHTI